MTGNRLYYYRREMASHPDYLPDMLNDEFVVLKKIPGKK